MRRKDASSSQMAKYLIPKRMSLALLENSSEFLAEVMSLQRWPHSCFRSTTLNS